MSVLKGWEDILNLLEKGTAIIVAGGEKYNIPSLHNFYRKNPDKADRYWKSIEHLGFGYFKGYTEHGKFEFDGGGAMRHYYDEDNKKETYESLSYSPLRADKEVLKDLDYDIDSVKEIVKNIIKGCIEKGK